MTPAVFIPSYSNFIHYDCPHIERVHPIFCPHLIIFLGVLNFTPPLECLHYLFVCNLSFRQILFLYIQILRDDCSHIEDVQRRGRSRGEFGLVHGKDTGVCKFGSYHLVGPRCKFAHKWLDPGVYSNTCLKRPLKKDKTRVLKTNGNLMKVTSIAECYSRSILQYF